jgi:predicted glutamate--cysteine ligase
VLLPKGFEIEIYTGTPQGQIVGLSDRIVADLDGFVTEPDSRYTTAPLCSYDRLLCELVLPRRRLRSYLQRIGDYTLIPGSTLSLGGSDRFWRSDPYNPYHTYIEKTYGTKVVTASVHINIGLDNPEDILRACRLVRVEAPLYLALSAASPFLDAQITGHHSTRWAVFPKTPTHVPIFTGHAHFIRWTEEQLAAKTMQNVRHLWSSVRPNGNRRPYDLNRLELRICDLIADPISLLAVTALIEARIYQLLSQPNLDPLISSQFTPEELVELTDNNETVAARNSLDAQLRHWQDGRTILAKDWIAEIYQQVRPIALNKGFACFLSPLQKILREGNTAQQWLAACDRGLDPDTVIQLAIADLENQEIELEGKLCQELATFA